MVGADNSYIQDIMWRFLKFSFLFIIVAVIAGVGMGVWVLYDSKTTNPHNYATIGDIPTPWFYLNTDADKLFPNCFYYKATELRHF